MHTREENGWHVPYYETKLSGSCRPYFHVHYRDWDKIKTTIFSIPDKERHTFIDVGANIGLISVPAKQYFKRVYAILDHKQKLKSCILLRSSWLTVKLQY